MFDIPVIDEQEYDWEAEIARVLACRAALKESLRTMTFNPQAVAEAIALLVNYEDELEGYR